MGFFDELFDEIFGDEDEKKPKKRVRKSKKKDADFSIESKEELPTEIKEAKEHATAEEDLEKEILESDEEWRWKKKLLKKWQSSIWVIIDDLWGILDRQKKKMDKFLIGFTLDETKTMKGIPLEDHNAHFHIVGGSGTGKSRFLESLMAQDMANQIWGKKDDGENTSGFGVIDPNGDLIKHMKTALALNQRISWFENSVVLIDPTDEQYSVCLNPLEPIEGVGSADIASELVGAFAKIWGNSWGARMQQIFRNALVALIDNRLTLREVPLILNNSAVRRKLLLKVRDELCLEFFEKYEKWTERDKLEYTESTLNKLDDFLAIEKVRDIFLSPTSTFNMREIIDNGKNLLVNLDRGQLKGASDLLGSLIMSKIQLAAFARSGMHEDYRKPFYLYIDEFQNFATKSFLEILSQARKYGLYLTLAHQNLAQLEPELRASILSNCKLMACFRVSRPDAEVMAKEIYGGVYDEPQDWETRIQRLQKFQEREFIFKNKNKGGIVVLKTLDVPLAWQPYYKTEEENYNEGGGKGEVNIGKDSRRLRSEIRAEYIERRAGLLANDDPETYWRHKV